MKRSISSTSKKSVQQQDACTSKMKRKHPIEYRYEPKVLCRFPSTDYADHDRFPDHCQIVMSIFSISPSSIHFFWHLVLSVKPCLVLFSKQVKIQILSDWGASGIFSFICTYGLAIWILFLKNNSLDYDRTLWRQELCCLCDYLRKDTSESGNAAGRNVWKVARWLSCKCSNSYNYVAKSAIPSNPWLHPLRNPNITNSRPKVITNSY